MFGLALVWIAFLSIDYALMLVTEGTIDRFPTPFGPLTPPRDDRMNAADRHQRGGQVATLGTQERLTLRKRATSSASQTDSTSLLASVLMLGSWHQISVCRTWNVLLFSPRASDTSGLVGVERIREASRF